MNIDFASPRASWEFWEVELALGIFVSTDVEHTLSQAKAFPPQLVSSHALPTCGSGSPKSGKLLDPQQIVKETVQDQLKSSLRSCYWGQIFFPYKLLGTSPSLSKPQLIHL